ncbi:hypothetical protein A3Q56_02646 [Intoshia linei]|uniref:NEDD8-activating enzyme E1 catalytic subunit n=1 Tax=Intoshia linei TaxID=1819745 RepID=A0A177B5L9_9BILA|nr:hypothetical protein A3Q56_02646 [Intoshia linei]
MHNSIYIQLSRNGGTEGLMGSVRVIFPSLTACLECTIDLFSSKVTYPVCTICNFPKSFGHCVLYAKIVLWEKVIPFEEDFSTTNEKHLKWILNEAIQHAKKWNIEYNVDTNKIQEILSNIIPAVITTNCSISAICCMEAFKIVTSAFHTLDNLLNLNFYNGVYMNCVRLDKTKCVVCEAITQGIGI